MERERDATQSAQISWQASKRGLKKLHERVNNDERRNARAREERGRDAIRVLAACAHAGRRG